MPILNRPLRVMHIISGDLWAGAEAQAFTLLKHLSPGISLQVVLLNDGELCNRLRDAGISVVLVPELKIGSVKILFRLMKLIREFNPDVLHTHRQKENILGNIANMLAHPLPAFRAKSVRTAHSAPDLQPTGKKAILVWADNWVGLHLQQAVIAVSGDLSMLLQNIFPVAAIYVIHNGVDQEELQRQAGLTDYRLSKPNAKHLGIIGRLDPIKRIDLFLHIAANLIKNHSNGMDLQFHIIGDGKQRLELEALMNQLEICQYVTFHGHRQDIPSCIKSLDCILMCSDHEGTPMIALEAMALGTPMVVHAVGGLKEIFADYPDLLVQNQVPAEYVDSIAKLLINLPKSVELNKNYFARDNAIKVKNLYINICGFN